MTQVASYQSKFHARWIETRRICYLSNMYK